MIEQEARDAIRSLIEFYKDLNKTNPCKQHLITACKLEKALYYQVTLCAEPVSHIEGANHGRMINQ